MTEAYTPTVTIVEFLAARLDEEVAALYSYVRNEPAPISIAVGEMRVLDGATTWDDPARYVLASIRAKQCIVALDICGACAVEHRPCDHRDATLRLLAQPYADHPDYDPDWKPEAP